MKCIKKGDRRSQRGEAEEEDFLAEKKIYESSLWLTRFTRRRAAPLVDLSASSVEAGPPQNFMVLVTYKISFFIILASSNFET